MTLLVYFAAFCLLLTHKHTLNHQCVSTLLLPDNYQPNYPLFCLSHQTANFIYISLWSHKLGGRAAGFICSAGRQSNFAADCVFIYFWWSKGNKLWKREVGHRLAAVCDCWEYRFSSFTFTLSAEQQETKNILWSLTGAESWDAEELRFIHVILIYPITDRNSVKRCEQVRKSQDWWKTMFLL